jgi:hypothetical protein
MSDMSYPMQDVVEKCPEKDDNQKVEYPQGGI